jgi:hypothetical protein
VRSECLPAPSVLRSWAALPWRLWIFECLEKQPAVDTRGADSQMDLAEVVMSFSLLKHDWQW